MNELITINIFGQSYSGILEEDKRFHGGDKITVETSGGTMDISAEIFKNKIDNEK